MSVQFTEDPAAFLRMQEAGDERKLLQRIYLRSQREHDEFKRVSTLNESSATLQRSRFLTFHNSVFISIVRSHSGSRR